MTEYRIDDLARAAGTTTRNVRAYRERGLLPPPVKRGRVGIYDDSHLARLRLIDVLMQRGYTAAHIGDFIDGWESGKDLTEVLGLQRALTEPWLVSEDSPTMPVEDARKMLGDTDGEQLRRMVTYGLARIDGDRLTFTDPKLVQGFTSLAEFGFGLRHLLDVHERLYAAVDSIAKDMITTVKSRIVDMYGEGWIPQGDEVARATAMLGIMRTLSVDSVNSILGRTLDKNLQEQLGEYLAPAVEGTAREGRTSA